MSADKIDLKKSLDKTASKFTRRRYTPNEVMHCISLHCIGWTVRQIVEETGVPISTVQRWIKGDHHLSVIDIEANTNKLKSKIQSQLIVNASRCLALAMDDEKTAKASTKDLTVSAGIMLDKSLVMDGQANTIVGHQQLAGRIIDVTNQRASVQSDQSKVIEEIELLEANCSSDCYFSDDHPKNEGNS